MIFSTVFPVESVADTLIGQFPYIAWFDMLRDDPLNLIPLGSPVALYLTYPRAPSQLNS